MLKKLCLLQTYLFIFQCSYEIHSKTVEPTSTTISIEDRINQNISPFMELLQKYRNAEDKEAAAELKGTIYGKLYSKLEEWFKQIFNLQEETKQLYEEKGRMKEKQKNYAKVLRIIGTRSKVEDMVEKLYPLRKNPKTGEQIYGKPASSYCDALHEMLTSKNIRFTQDPFVCMLRQRLIDNNVPVSVFMKFIRWLYRQLSDKACHKMAQFSPPLPRYDNVKEIKEMLECIDVDQDVPALICVQIVLQPLDMPSTVSVDTTPSTSVLTTSNTSVSVTPSTANREE